MPEITPKLGLKKPLGNESFNRDSYNENLDLLDQNVETPVGAQAKALAAETAAKAFADQEVGAVQNDVDEHFDETAINAHLGKNIGIEDTGGNFTATEVEGALSELFTSANNGKNSIASAVGAPLTCGDTFAKMTSDIETIKTNLATALNNKQALAEGYVPPDLGDALSSDVRNTKTFSSSTGENISGTLDLSLLTPTNIRKNIMIDGVTGLLEEVVAIFTSVGISADMVNRYTLTGSQSVNGSSITIGTVVAPLGGTICVKASGSGINTANNFPGTATITVSNETNAVTFSTGLIQDTISSISGEQNLTINEGDTLTIRINASNGYTTAYFSYVEFYALVVVQNENYHF